MKQQATTSRRSLEAIVTRENGTRQNVAQNALISSYIREIELVLSNLYTDIAEIFFAFELASLNKPSPIQKTYVYSAQHFNSFRTRYRVHSPIETRVYEYIL
jgi:hypothetical protein